MASAPSNVINLRALFTTMQLLNRLPSVSPSDDWLEASRDRLVSRL